MSTLLLSPHFDDAVISCGQYLAATPEVAVLTVFAGTPSNSEVLTAYDQKTGFRDAADAVETRKQEDILSLAYLKATCIHAGFPDSQYGQPSGAEDIYQEIMRRIGEYHSFKVIAPMGILHPDHILVRDLALRIAREYRQIEVFLYEELPSRVISPDSRTVAKNEVAGRRFTLTEEAMQSGDLAKKVIALNAYKSQTWGMDIHTLCVPERFWRVNV